jgi:hypothetical protein
MLYAVSRGKDADVVHSARLVAVASPLLVGAAFVAELLSEMSYAELLGRSVAAASRSDTDVPSRNYRGLGPLFMLRLTVCGNGAAHVLPGGRAAAATVTGSQGAVNG